MKPKQADDERFMRRALQLAQRGRGYVEPNPVVGCVIVRGSRVIGEGFHHRFGASHAEVEALRDTTSARGATAYVTLEPCCHHGKTPPCCDALIAAGVSRVVAATEDPHADRRGRGMAALRAAGVHCELGLLEQEARNLNAPFFKLVEQGRPWVILKWAQSLDGKIATRTGDSKWISDETCRTHAHRVRGRMDAIVVGINTVLRDDPMLTCRTGRPRRTATRVILDPRLRTPTNSQLVRTARNVPTWIVHGGKAAGARMRRLENAGCRVLRVAQGKTGLSLPGVLRLFGRQDMSNVLIEGGGRLLGAFFDQHLADELNIYVAPLLLGGSAAPGPLDGIGRARVRDGLHLAINARLTRLGNGYFLAARPNGAHHA